MVWVAVQCVQTQIPLLLLKVSQAILAAEFEGRLRRLRALSSFHDLVQRSFRTPVFSRLTENGSSEEPAEAGKRQNSLQGNASKNLSTGLISLRSFLCLLWPKAWSQAQQAKKPELELEIPCLAWRTRPVTPRSSAACDGARASMPIRPSEGSLWLMD